MKRIRPDSTTQLDYTIQLQCGLTLSRIVVITPESFLKAFFFYMYGFYLSIDGHWPP